MKKVSIKNLEINGFKTLNKKQSIQITGGDKGKISPYQGLHRFFANSDRNSHSDGNGLGNDPQSR